ncbi:IQ and ubiquitin-like domain-containing protein [Teleopsis dalmanni]|uniref:IQ and ubiquitin-like domain-containing protein n=1 Tax=Teleopsis dalmanni TaxID=139649 RepID=UPI0018CCE94B|nr:IQ and ubiquitin-like domain-containing protein [Teleopsis dalmanni]XP_037960671.1 IQ and ubiquitin-like domain-containing protein [Teleopsis dalmanni]
MPRPRVNAQFRLPDKKRFFHAYPGFMTVLGVKKDLGRKFEVPALCLELWQGDEEMNNKLPFSKTKPNEFGIHKFQLQVRPLPNATSMDELPILDLNIYNTKQKLPELLNVDVPCMCREDGTPLKVVVEIANKAIEKPELCSFKDTRTGLIYMEAFTQTGPANTATKWVGRYYYSVDTQTQYYAETVNDTMHDKASQCWLDGVNVRFISSDKDAIIIPTKYITYYQMKRAERRIERITVMQHYLRRLNMKATFKWVGQELRRLRRNFDKYESDFYKEQRRLIARIERLKKFPYSQEHFELLYNEVFKWRTAEVDRINSLRHGASRIAELIELLSAESRMLVELDRRRVLAVKKRQEVLDERNLAKLGDPVQFISYKDLKVDLYLLRVQRAKLLNDMLAELKRPTQMKERIKILTEVKRMLGREKHFKKLAELFELVEREINILKHTRIKVNNTYTLHRRLNFLFKELIRTYSDPKTEEIPKHLCEVCSKVKPLSKFSLSVRKEQVTSCEKCQSVNLAGRNTMFFKAVLRAMHRDEKLRHTPGSLAFIMQIDDIRYIIEKIWHGRSILSLNNDLRILRLPRWVRSEPWAPWNCICVTEEEARYHNQIKDIHVTYDEKLHTHVKYHHFLSLQVFHKSIEVGIEHVETFEWWDVGLNKQRTMPPYAKD